MQGRREVGQGNEHQAFSKYREVRGFFYDRLVSCRRAAHRDEMDPTDRNDTLLKNIVSLRGKKAFYHEFSDRWRQPHTMGSRGPVVWGGGYLCTVWYGMVGLG